MQTTLKLEHNRKNSGKLRKLLQIVSQIPEMSLLLIMFLTMIDMLLSVITRYLLNNALFWAEEFGTFGLVWMTMIGTGVAVKRSAHFTMPTFMDRFPLRARYIISLINHSLVIAFGFVMVFTGISLTRASMVMFSPALEINLGIINSSAIVGGILILIYETGKVIDLIVHGLPKSSE